MPWYDLTIAIFDTIRYIVPSLNSNNVSVFRKCSALCQEKGMIFDSCHIKIFFAYVWGTMLHWKYHSVIVHIPSEFTITANYGHHRSFNVLTVYPKYPSFYHAVWSTNAVQWWESCLSICLSIKRLSESAEFLPPCKGEKGVCLSVCPSEIAWIVTEWKKNLSRFLYFTKDHSAKFFPEKNGW